MELTATLITLQGILTRLCKTTDSLAKIKYKGGNEMKISSVVKEIESFLNKEKCIVDDEVNKEKESTIRDIVFFLALNCEFKEEPEMKDNEHLMGINLKLSTCLFANVVTELRLVELFVAIMDKFPFSAQTEFLQEFLVCLKKADGSLNLGFTTSIVNSVIKQVNQFSATDRKLNEDVEGLVEVSAEILDVLRGLNVDQMQSMKTVTIYREMGYKLLKLLQLLYLCDPSKEHLAPLIRNIINISCDITAAVTVDVFCVWAEVEENGEPLQAAVASVAYYVVNKFQGCQPAKQLLMMLGPIARKPKSVQELIRSADAAKIVQMIEREDENQKHWFQALFHTQVFSDQKSMACVDKYYKLCGEAEVERILSFCRGKEIDDKKLNLVLKCVSVIPLSRLVILVTRYFHSYGIHTAVNSKINKEKLVLLLNKIEESEQFKKEMLMLLLQNLKEVLSTLYRECLKNSVYSTQLKSTFSDFKEILVVGDAALLCLQPLITPQILLENHEQLAILLKTLIETKCIEYDTAINGVIMLQLVNHLNGDPLGPMIILNELYLPNKLGTPEEIISVVLKLLSECRSGLYFYSYDVTKQNTAMECVKFLSKCEECNNLNISDFQEGSIDQYYAKKISCNLQVSLFDFLFPHVDLNGDGYYRFVCDLIKILPTYVADEWKEVASALQAKHGTESTVKILTDVVLLFSALEETKSGAANAFVSCLNSYMISIKNLQQSNIEDQVIITKCVCCLLRNLKPKEQEQAVIITGLISDESLKVLFKDRNFINCVIAIRNKSICKLLAYKMLNMK